METMIERTRWRVRLPSPSALGVGMAISVEALGGTVGRRGADIDALFIAAALDGVVATQHVVHSGFGAMTRGRVAAASASMSALEAMGPAVLEGGRERGRGGGGTGRDGGLASSGGVGAVGFSSEEGVLGTKVVQVVEGIDGVGRGNAMDGEVASLASSEVFAATVILFTEECVEVVECAVGSGAVLPFVDGEGEHTSLAEHS